MATFFSARPRHLFQVSRANSSCAGEIKSFPQEERRGTGPSILCTSFLGAAPGGDKNKTSGGGCALPSGSEEDAKERWWIAGRGNRRRASRRVSRPRRFFFEWIRCLRSLPLNSSVFPGIFKNGLLCFLAKEIENLLPGDAADSPPVYCARVRPLWILNSGFWGFSKRSERNSTRASLARFSMAGAQRRIFSEPPRDAGDFRFWLARGWSADVGMRPVPRGGVIGDSRKLICYKAKLKQSRSSR